MASKALTPLQIENNKIKKEAKKQKQASTYKIFNGIMQTMRLPEPIHEHVFHPTRKWKFDYAWPSLKIALEVEGGVFTGGRHTNPMGFTKDMEKYNAAVILGWRIVRCTPKDLLTTGTANLISQLYNYKP